MTLASIIEPVVVEASYDYPPNQRPTPKGGGAIKVTKTKAETALDRKALEAELKRLIVEERRSIRATSDTLGVGQKTLRSICRTLRIGPYAPVRAGERRSRSSQVPYGWRSIGGVLAPEPTEMKWVQLARQMRSEGASLHEIARTLNDRQVPTKNGGRWHAKTISQILDFNDRHERT
ncbi:MAG: recombinase family protein [Bdellovibrionales bacterium]|nr:recombinase family protein [Bdellovibrionales bacterium]